MFEGINLVAVLGTTFFMMASATVWFSTMFFGKAWMRALKITEAEIEASRQNLFWHLGLTALLYGLALTVLSYVVAHVTELEVTVLEAALAIAAFAVALLGSAAVWENRSRAYFMITTGFYVYFVVVGMFILAYWPW